MRKTLTGDATPCPLKSAVRGALSPRVAEDVGACAHIFRRAWHDWNVKRDGQFAAFTRYIRENLERAWLRKRNAHLLGEMQGK